VKVGWGIGGSVELQTVCSKSVHSGNGRTIIALRCLLLVLVSMPLRIVNLCCSGFPVSGVIKMPGPLTLYFSGATNLWRRRFQNNSSPLESV